MQDEDQSFAGVRAGLLKQYLGKNDVEGRLSRCLDTLLQNQELPSNPYPTLVRALRREEALSVLWPDGASELMLAKQVWADSQAPPPSRADQRLVSLGNGSVWQKLHPLVDPTSVARLAGQLAATQLLSPMSTSEYSQSGDLLFRAGCALGGGHVFAPRSVHFPRTIEVHACLGTCLSPGS